MDKVVLAHVLKAVNVAQGVMALIDAGFPEEAFGLSRTVIEIALNLRYITNRKSEQRAKRFIHYVARWKMELMRRTLKHFYHTNPDGSWVLDAHGQKIPYYTKAELKQVLKKYAMYAKAARKYAKRTSWSDTGGRASKGGVWMMAMEADRYDSLNGAPMKWDFDYEVWASAVMAGSTCIESGPHAPHIPRITAPTSSPVGP